MAHLRLQSLHRRLGFVQRPFCAFASGGFGGQRASTRCRRLEVGAAWPPPACAASGVSRRTTVTGTSPSCTKRRR